MKRRTKIILAACLVLLAVLVGCWIYVSDYYHADETAVSAMAFKSDSVQIIQGESTVWFVPSEPSAGLIFYPGGKVEHTAYAPLLLDCAQRGILCALVKMPCNLAVLDANAADNLKQQYPDVGRWYMAGHSLGGAMAAGYAAEHDGDFSGLILLAAYSAKDISQTSLSVLSVCGSEDGVMNRDSYEKYRSNLPADAVELVIEGGCHAQFGSYGPQDGDGAPLISAEEQKRQTAEAIAAFIAR